jgi:hypothetical protein
MLLCREKMLVDLINIIISLISLKLI